MGTDRISAVIARQEWFKPVEEGLQKLLHQAFAGLGPNAQKIEDFLHGTWIGHPLHVILTDVPIGAWTSTVVFDLLESISSRKEFATAADTSLIIGLMGAVGTAVTGLTDWQDIDPPARRIGLVHGLMNVSSVALFATSLIMRRYKLRAIGRGLGVLGYAVAAAAAHLGGSLVYEQGIGIDHTAGKTLPEDFVSLLPESELPEGQSRRAEYNGVPILLVRRGNQIFALIETCSHLGGPLSEGTLADDSIQCPWHGSRFALEDGRVLNGPAVHPQPCFESRLRNGKIEVRKSKIK